MSGSDDVFAALGPRRFVVLGDPVKRRLMLTASKTCTMGCSGTLVNTTLFERAKL